MAVAMRAASKPLASPSQPLAFNSQPNAAAGGLVYIRSSAEFLAQAAALGHRPPSPSRTAGLQRSSGQSGAPTPRKDPAVGGSAGTLPGHSPHTTSPALICHQPFGASPVLCTTLMNVGVVPGSAGAVVSAGDVNMTPGRGRDHAPKRLTATKIVTGAPASAPFIDCSRPAFLRPAPTTPASTHPVAVTPAPPNSHARSFLIGSVVSACSSLSDVGVKGPPSVEQLEKERSEERRSKHHELFSTLLLKLRATLMSRDQVTRASRRLDIIIERHGESLAALYRLVNGLLHSSTDSPKSDSAFSSGTVSSSTVAVGAAAAAAAAASSAAAAAAAAAAADLEGGAFSNSFVVDDESNGCRSGPILLLELESARARLAELHYTLMLRQIKVKKRRKIGKRCVKEFRTSASVLAGNFSWLDKSSGPDATMSEHMRLAALRLVKKPRNRAEELRSALNNVTKGFTQRERELEAALSLHNASVDRGLRRLDATNKLLRSFAQSAVELMISLGESEMETPGPSEEELQAAAIFNHRLKVLARPRARTSDAGGGSANYLVTYADSRTIIKNLDGPKFEASLLIRNSGEPLSPLRELDEDQYDRA